MQYIVIAIFFILSSYVSAWAGSSFSSSGNITTEIEHRMGAGNDAYVYSGCEPAVPTSSTTLDAFTCTAMVKDGSTPPRLIPAVQSTSSTVGPLNSGDGTYWIAIHNSTGSTVSGWTRQAGTHYIWKFVAAKPNDPAGALIFAKVTVATVVTAVTWTAPHRPQTAGKLVYMDDYITGSETGTDADPYTGNFQNAVDAVEALGGGTLILSCNSSYEAQLTLPRATRANIKGCGESSALMNNSGDGTDTIKYDTTETTVVSNGHFLQDFRITNAAGSGHAIYMNNNASGNGFRWGVYRNLHLVGVSETGDYGIKGEFVTQWTFEDITVREYDRCWDFSNVNGRPSNVVIRRSTAKNCDTEGFRLDNSRNFIFERTRVEGSTAEKGYHLRNSTDNVTFIGAGIEDNHSDADYYLDTSQYLTFIGTGSSTNTTGHGFQLIDVDNSTWIGGDNGDHSGASKYAFSIDSSSRGNTFLGVGLVGGIADVSDSGVETTSLFNISTASQNFLLGQTLGLYWKNITTTTTLGNNEVGFITCDATLGAVTLTLPGVDSTRRGALLLAKKTDSSANACTLDGSGAETIDNATTYRLISQNDFVVLESDGTEWHIVAQNAKMGIGAAPPAACNAGQMWIDTDETDDTNCTTTADNSLCLCIATDTWTALENN